MQPADSLVSYVQFVQLFILGLLMIAANQTKSSLNKGNKLMGAYDDMLQSEIIERTLNYKGRTKQVYFKQLTAGQRINMSRGQKFAVNAKSREEGVQVDMGDSMERGHKFLLFAHVDKDGVQVFKSLNEIQALPEDLVSELQALADDALGGPKVVSEEKEVNPSPETNS